MCANHSNFNNNIAKVSKSFGSFPVASTKSQASRSPSPSSVMPNYLADAKSVDEITSAHAGDNDSLADRVSKTTSANSAYADLTVNNEELKELEKQKETSLAKISEQQNRLSLANSGKEETIAAKKDAVDEARQTYLETIDKSQNPMIKEIAEEIKLVEGEITETNTAIGEYTNAISEAQVNISSVTSQIAALESESKAYDNRISALSTKDSQGKDSSIQSQINTLRDAKGKVIAKKEQCAALKTELEQAKKELEEAKQQEEQNLENLKRQREDLDLKVQLTLDMTVKKALDDFRTAENDYELAKKEVVDDATKLISDATAEVADLESKISAKKQEIFEKEAALQAEQAADQAQIDQIISGVYGGGGGGSDGSMISGGSIVSGGSVTPSAEQLQNTKSQSKETLNSKIQEFNNVLDGQSNTLKPTLEKKNLSFQSFFSGLSAMDSALATEIQNLKTQVDAKETEINNIDKQIVQAQVDEVEADIAYSKASQELSKLQEYQTKYSQQDVSKLSADKQTKLNELKQKITSAIQQKQEEVNRLSSQRGSKVQNLTNERQRLQTEYENLQNQLKSKMKSAADKYQDLSSYQIAYDAAVKEYDVAKNQEISSKKGEVTTALSSYKEASTSALSSEVSASTKEFAFGDVDCKFDLKLSDYQEKELSKVKTIFEQNKDKYEAVSRATGVPAELICAIHYRESGCKFNTYLHNGDPLGKPTVHVPKGKMFSDWTTAAIDAIKSHSSSGGMDRSNIDSQLDFAERYNGLGYRKRGLQSPYVWSGTSKYSGGMYVADGVFSASAVDKRVGVAAMLQRLYA